MKRFLFLYAVLALLLASCGAVIDIDNIRIQLPTAAAHDSPTPTATLVPSTTPVTQVSATTLVNLNVRAGPSTSFSIVTVLPANTTVVLTGRLSDNTWLRIAQGWISGSSQLVRINGNINNVPIQITDPTPTQEVRHNRISYNINGEGVPNFGYLEDHFEALCPSTVLVMNNLSLANTLHRLSRSCNSLVISRSYSPLEGDEWFYRSTANIVGEWFREGSPHILRYSTNEPSFGGAQSIQAFVQHSVDLMRIARQNGFTVVMGNFAVGSVRMEDIASGAYDPFIRALAQYHHYLGLHEYTTAVLPFGVSQWPREWLLDRNRVQQGLWPTASQIPLAFWTSAEFGSQYPPYYHLRRGDWFLLRADAIGVQRPVIILTEFGWDNLSDIKATLEPLRSQFGLPQYFFDMRGVNTYQRLWPWYWPQWSFGIAACEQLKWADVIYPPDYIGFNLFTWSNNPHWLQTDFSGQENPALYELHDCLEAYANN